MEMQDVFYRCCFCGSNVLIVIHNYVLTESREQLLDCVCDDPPPDGIAAERTVHNSYACSEWGQLDDDHHWHFDERELTESLAAEEDNSNVFYDKCTADSHDWCTTEENQESHDDEWEVTCGGCDREIEFGWSHPDRGGRIWTAEDCDFNPWKTWPEPRYRSGWEQKGWIRPSRRENAVTSN